MDIDNIKSAKIGKNMLTLFPSELNFPKLLCGRIIKRTLDIPYYTNHPFPTFGIQKKTTFAINKDNIWLTNSHSHMHWLTGTKRSNYLLLFPPYA